jgi:hypothetical protein
MIKPGTNYLASHGAQRVALTWRRFYWLVLRLPTPDELRANLDRARVAKTYTQAELEALQAAGWEFEAIE